MSTPYNKPQRQAEWLLCLFILLTEKNLTDKLASVYFSMGYTLGYTETNITYSWNLSFSNLPLSYLNVFITTSIIYKNKYANQDMHDNYKKKSRQLKQRLY